MKTFYYYALLITLLVSSCKKDDKAETAIRENPNQKFSTKGFYKVGDIVEIKIQNSFEENVPKVSYIWTGPAGYNTYAPLVKGVYPSDMELARSNNGLYSLYFQQDGNLVLYKRISQNGPLNPNALWASNVQAPGYPGAPTPWHINFAADGNILCYIGTNNFYWVSGITTTGSNIVWMLQDDGNFVGYSNHRILPVTPTAIEVLGPAFASTNTYGGIKSPNFGSLLPAF